MTGKPRATMAASAVRPTVAPTVAPTVRPSGSDPSKSRTNATRKRGDSQNRPVAGSAHAPTSKPTTRSRERRTRPETGRAGAFRGT